MAARKTSNREQSKSAGKPIGGDARVKTARTKGNAKRAADAENQMAESLVNIDAPAADGAPKSDGAENTKSILLSPDSGDGNVEKAETKQAEPTSESLSDDAAGGGRTPLRDAREVACSQDAKSSSAQRKEAAGTDNDAPTAQAVGTADCKTDADRKAEPQTDGADEKKEDALKSIRELKHDDAPQKKRNVFLRILAVIFFPITGLVVLFNWFTRKIKLSITTKTTIIFTLLFGVLIAAYVIFIITSIEKQLQSGAIDKAEYLRNLKLASIILVIVFVALGAALGNIASQYMMTPLRRMIKQIDEVHGENLSVRLDPVDRQDELTELTERINDMLAELEDTFERQSNFISDASHELKTPISVIQGYANMLKRWGKTDAALLDESIETLLAEADNMKRIVEQLLLLAKIGNLTMSKTRFDMTNEIRETVEKYSIAGASKKQIRFVGNEEIWVETDKNMLIESVRALIDNAVKYTPDGGKITVSCKRNASGATIKVSDTGMGIAPEHLPHIFERFYRCDKARSRESGSSGLGLTITKSIVEMMGGKISVDSKPGVGSDFTIQLY